MNNSNQNLPDLQFWLWLGFAVAGLVAAWWFYPHLLEIAGRSGTGR